MSTNNLLIPPRKVERPGAFPSRFVQEGFTANGHLWRTTTWPLYKDAFPSLNTAHTKKIVHPSFEKMISTQLEKDMRAAAKRGLNLKGEKENCQKGILNCTQPRPNLQYQVEFPGQDPIVCRYLLPKNSPVNGQKYLDSEGNEHQIEEGVSSSLYRPAQNLTLARQMVTVDPHGKEETVCYAGRPDTQEKFKELGSMVFLGQKESGKGITYDPSTDSFELNFVMNSFISTCSLMGSEAALIEKEYEELQNFNGTTITVTDKKGNEYSVKVNICFFSRQFNFINTLEKSLPTGFSGERRSREMSNKTKDLYQMIAAPHRSNREIQTLLSILNKNEKDHRLTAEEEIFTRIYLCQQADIPLVIHCRSCVDRTTIGAAMAYAIKQWKMMGREIPFPPYKLLDNEDFKELWLANVPPGLLISMYSRTVPGLKWQPGPLPYIGQHPAALRLMPERFLTSYHLGNPLLHILSKENLSFTAVFLWLPLCLLKSPIKAFTQWILAPDLPHIEKLWGIVRLIGAILLLVVGILLLSLAFVFGTIAGFFLMFPGMWREIGYIKKDSKVGKVASSDDLLLGVKLVKALLSLSPSYVLKDGIKMNGNQSLLFNGKGQD